MFTGSGLFTLKEIYLEIQALLNSMIDALPQKVLCRDLEGKLVFANKAFIASAQKRLDEIIGKRDSELLPRELANLCAADEKRARQTRRVQESVLTGPGTGDRNTLSMTMPVYDAGGQMLGTQTMFWDESDLTRPEASSLDSDLLRALMDSTTDIVYFKDLESRFIRINKAHAARFGLKDPREANGKSDFDFFTLEHAQGAYDDEQKIIKSGRPMPDIEEKETWADREDTWVLSTKSPLYDSSGKIVGTWGITKDITERKRTEEALQRNMSQFLEFVSQVSRGDLTLRGQSGEDTLGLVRLSVNKMLDNFTAMLTDVKQLGLSVSSSASQIMVAAEKIEHGTQRQNDEITNLTSSVQEMAATMGQVSKNASASAEAARRALEIAQKGDRSVADTSQAMVRIDSAVVQTADKMRTLAKRSTEISEIIDLINDVAAQTNLLSLNAAIEAAHAGEAGLGFSVVAEEIRKLAERSARATRDVGKIIKAIQSETAEALSATESGLSEVKAGSNLAEQSREALSDISVAVGLSAELIEEISAAADEQAGATRNFANAMQTISGITMEASSGAHQTAQIIQGMVHLSEKLNQSISQFKTEKDSAANAPTKSP
jgi:PAS domain S-box-containing protein